jgi:hypothetical protein
MTSAMVVFPAPFSPMITVTRGSRAIFVSSKQRTFFKRRVANCPSDPVFLCCRVRAIVSEQPRTLRSAQQHSIALYHTHPLDELSPQPR